MPASSVPSGITCPKSLSTLSPVCTAVDGDSIGPDRGLSSLLAENERQIAMNGVRVAANDKHLE